MPSKLNPDPTTGADERGQVVVYPSSTDVFVDIDNDADYAFLQARLLDLDTHYHELKLILLSAAPSQSGLPHRHVYLRANRDLSDAERIALQGALGSDRVREFLSLLRAWQGGAATTFYEAPGWKDPRKDT